MRPRPLILSFLHWITCRLLIVGLAPMLQAQGPEHQPQIAGTIKAGVGVDLASLFEKQMKLLELRRASWLQQAEQATPKLQRRPLRPVAIVKVEQDTAGFQGWKIVVTNQPESVCNRPLLPGDDRLSPYGSHLMNSYCHAWSCTPAYFLRRQTP